MLVASQVTSIRLLAHDDPRAMARWDAFVLRHPLATFCHSAGWQTALYKVFRHPTYFLYLERDGEVCGVLPLAHVRSRLFGNALTALPFAVYGGVVADHPADALRLEEEALALAQRLDVDHLECRNVAQRHSDWPSKALYATFRKALWPDEASNLQEIPRRQRAMVRKGIRHGLIASVDADARTFFALYADNVHRHGTPALPLRWFETMRRTFGADCEILSVRTADGVPVSSVMSFYFRDEVLPYYAGDSLAARELAANDFKYWELMRRASAKACRVFDFGRSKVGTGTFAYKQHWGFEPTPLHYQYQLFGQSAMPQNNPSNPRYDLPIRIWRRLPLGLATRLGPLLSRSLG